MSWEAQTYDVPILVPWRTDNGSRADVWSTIQEHVWRESRVVVGSSPEGSFNRSAAINNAAELAGDWDVAVIADADSFVPPAQLSAAIQFARDSGNLVYPYTLWLSIDPHEVDNFWATGVLPDSKTRIVHLGTVSSVLVVPRKVWDKVNGFDENFTGWGYEDMAFDQAVRVLTGEPRRMADRVFHIEHKRPEEWHNRGGSPLVRANRERYQQYQRCVLKSDMANLVANNRATLEEA